MMSLWDALRMNMMISYQELVRTFPKLPEGFEDYFPGSYIDPEIEDYFNNLTPDMRDYFEVKAPDNAPDAPKQEPAKATKVFDDWEYRRKVFNALGIPC